MVLTAELFLLLGAILVTFGMYLLSPVAACITGGLFLMVIGALILLAYGKGGDN